MANGRRGALVTLCVLLVCLQGGFWTAVRALPAPESTDAPTAAASTDAADADATTAEAVTEPSHESWTVQQLGWPTTVASSTDETTKTPDDDLTTMSTLWTGNPTEGEAAMDGDDAEGDGEGEAGLSGVQSDENRTPGVQFKLYTRAHDRAPHLLRSDSLEGSDFDVGRKTVFVIHGFTGGASAESVVLIRDAVLWADDVNVVVVDWEPLAAGPHYAKAVLNTAEAAKALARRIEALTEAGLPLSLVHVIGFSLGAQVAGRAGAMLNATVGRLPRITGLDPARPGFHDKPESERLDAGDADFVLVVHTAAGFVSFEEPLGHADFYPNGGRSPQPPCLAGDATPLVCSHLVAPRYFAEAIYKPRNFRGIHCGSWRDFEAGLCAGREAAFLGMDTPHTTRGTFFLRTNALEPYGRGDTDDSYRAPPEHAHDEDDNAQRTARKHEPAVAAAVAAAPAPVAVSAPTALLLLGAAAAAMVAAAVVES